MGGGGILRNQRRVAGGEIFPSQNNLMMPSIMVSAINGDGLDTTSNLMMESNGRLGTDFDDESANRSLIVTGNYLQSGSRAFP